MTEALLKISISWIPATFGIAVRDPVAITILSAVKVAVPSAVETSISFGPTNVAWPR